jgi:hypothetical protein
MDYSKSSGIDIAEMVNSKMRAMQEGGQIDAMIEKYATKMVNDIIENMLRPYSDTYKALETAIKDQMKIDLNNISLPEYNKSLMVIVKRLLDRQITAKGLDKFETDLSALLTDSAPEKIKLSKLMEEFVKDIIANDEDRTDGEFSFHLEDVSHGSQWLHFDAEEGKQKYSCAYRMLLHKDGKPALIEINGKSFDKKLSLGGLYGFDALLFKMYSVGTIIEIDEDRVETSWDGR